jgi:hypothetical protein
VWYDGIMSERTKCSEVFQVGDLVKFWGIIYGTPHPVLGIVVSLDNGPFKDPDDPNMIQVKFGEHVKFISVDHPQPQLEIISAATEGEA